MAVYHRSGDIAHVVHDCLKRVGAVSTERNGDEIPQSIFGKLADCSLPPQSAGAIERGHADDRFGRHIRMCGCEGLHLGEQIQFHWPSAHFGDAGETVRAETDVYADAGKLFSREAAVLEESVAARTMRHAHATPSEQRRVVGREIIDMHGEQIVGEITVALEVLHG